MIMNETLTDQSKLGQEPINKQRRTLIGGALAALLASPRLIMAEDTDVPNDPFILLLKGIYQHVVSGEGPESNLGLCLSTVNLNDGSYSVTKIYPVFGISDNGDDKHSDDDKPGKKAIGNFYVQFAGNLAAYDLPGGAIAMQFTTGGFTPHPDGQGGAYLEGTFELTILEATGVYRAFKGGHNHMVDRLHQLANGEFDEFCFCVISQYQFP